jgi:hypothetical protein
LRIKYVGAALLIALVLSGCGAQNALRKKPTQPLSPEAALHISLDRFEHWTSLFASLKLRFAIHDTTFTARGHLMYLAGERYEVGFEKPYNRFIGTFYVTPSQLIYFDTHSIPTTYTLQDTVMLSRMIPMGVPNWDPRDILPFPVSGRSSGFQTDSVQTEADGRALVYGNGDDVSYVLTLDTQKGTVSNEQVQRGGRDLLLKKYERIKTVQGWPVATRVTCSNPTGDVTFTWSFSDIQLKAPDARPQQSISTSK